MRGIFWLAEEILAPPEEFCSMELVKGAVVGHIYSIIPCSVWVVFVKYCAYS